MHRKQMITVACQYRRYNSDLGCGATDDLLLRSPPKLPQEYTLHGVPKRLHCRPRIPVTPSKPGENYVVCGKSPKMVNGAKWGQEYNEAWSDLKMKLHHSQENPETNEPPDATIAGGPQPVYATETANVASRNLQPEVSAEETEINCDQKTILNNNSYEDLDKDPRGNQPADSYSEHGSRDGLAAKNITPPNSPTSENEPADDSSDTMLHHCQGHQISNNDINVIDESTIEEQSDVAEQESVSWYHRLVELELQNKTLQVPKNYCKSELPILCKCQPSLPNFPRDETWVSRRISRTERHVHNLMLKENSIKAREKVKPQQNPRKPAV